MGLNQFSDMSFEEFESIYAMPEHMASTHQAHRELHAKHFNGQKPKLQASNKWKEARYIGDREGDLKNGIDSFDYEWIDKQTACVMQDWF